MNKFRVGDIVYDVVIGRGLVLEINELGDVCVLYPEGLGCLWYIEDNSLVPDYIFESTLYQLLIEAKTYE